MAQPLKSAAAILAALTGLRLMLAATLPLAPDEAYYWTWSQALAPGYTDHPGMVALWIRAGTMAWGDTPLGVRLLGPLAMLLETWMLADAAERLMPGRRAGLMAGALWNAMPLVGAGAMIMTPDAPLLFFWCATLWALARLASGGAAGWWLVTGISAGLALTSKYTGAFLWVGIAIWLLATPPGRAWLRRPAPWCGAVLGGAVVLPNILWNAEHHWATILRQGGRVADWRPERAVTYLAELFGGQIGLASPGIWLLCVVGLIQCIRGWKAPNNVLLLSLSVPALVVFTEHALGDRVQGNWPAITYPAAICAVAALTQPRWRRLLWPSVGLGFAMTALVCLHAATEWLPIGADRDPAARQLAGWDAFAHQVDAIRRQEAADYAIAEEYATIAELAWGAPAGMTVLGLDARLDTMSLRTRPLGGRRGILIRAEHRGTEIDPTRWTDAQPLGFIERTGTRGIVERYRVWRVDGTGIAAQLPHRRVSLANQSVRFF